MNKSITELLEDILSAVYGEDVRKSIHDSIQKCYEDAIKEGNANMEVSQARGVYTSLSERIAADLSKTITKIDDGYSRLRTLIDSVASGSPFVANSISEMIDTARVYVNTTDGHWYWHDGIAWQDGGVYQASEDSQTVNKLVNDVADINNSLDTIYSKNKLDPNEITTGIYYHNGTVAANDSYYYSKLIPVSKNDIVYFSKSNGGRVTIRELAAFNAEGDIVTDSGFTNLQTSYEVPDGISGIIISLHKNTFPAEDICVTINEDLGFTTWFRPYFVIKSPYFEEYVNIYTSIYKVNSSMNLDNIQKILEINENKLIIFEPGSYNFSSSLYINGNTTLILYNCDLYFTNAISFRNSKESDSINGYNGESNIKILGGNIFYGCALFSHCKNIKFKNVDFKNANYSHFIQICGCKNVEFELCDFEGMADTVSQISSEMIQLDPCQYSNFPYYSQDSISYDGTVNKDIFINKCKFLKGEENSGYEALVIAIGTHDNSLSFFENIKIKNCYFDECSRATIEICGWNNVLIEENKVKNSNAFIWHFGNSNVIKIIKNFLEKATYVYKMEQTAIGENILLIDNENLDCRGGFPYRIYNASNVRIANNHLKNGTSCLIKLYNTTDLFCNNNIVDTFTLDGNTNGIIIADDCANILSMNNAYLNIVFGGQENIIYEINTKEESRFVESKNDILIA